MSDTAVLFLGVIALAVSVQCVFVVLAAQSLRDAGGRVNELCRRFDAEIRPTLEDLRQGAANLRAVSQSGREQAARIETFLSTTIGNIETAVESVRSLVAEPIATLTELSAFWGGLRRGFDSQRNAPPKRRYPPPARREDSDEHLFIG